MAREPEDPGAHLAQPRALPARGRHPRNAAQPADAALVRSAPGRRNCVSPLGYHGAVLARPLQLDLLGYRKESEPKLDLARARDQLSTELRFGAWGWVHPEW